MGLLIGACNKETATRIDVTVDADAALTLQSIKVRATADGKMDFEKAMPASGRQHLTILLPELTTPLAAVVTATGYSDKGGTTKVVWQAADVLVTPGQAVAVVLRLSIACRDPICKDGETCRDGTCGPRPRYGQGDAGGPVDAGDGRNDVPVQNDAGADGSNGGDTHPDTPPACPADMHSCPGGCVRNNDPHTCGASCTPCLVPTNGTATCDGTSCGGSCDLPTQQLCLGACIDKTASCAGDCPPATHLCNGLCPSLTDVTACGTACRVCPTDPNGVAQCVGGACAIACNNGFKTCPGTNLCIPTAGCCTSADCTARPTNTVGLCGTANTCSYPCAPNFKMCGNACIADTACCTSSECTAGGANTVGTCNTTAHTCSYPCNGSAHNCSGACVLNTSTANCGTTSCTPCPQPTNSTATCNGTSCDFTCSGSTHKCGGACVSNNSTANCGTSSCMACTPPANSTATCNGTSCGFNCNLGTQICNACQGWAFDTGVEGWALHHDPTAVDGATGLTTEQGTLAIKYAPAQGYGAMVKVKLCSTGSQQNLVGRTIQAQIRFVPDPTDEFTFLQLLFCTDPSIGTCVSQPFSRRQLTSGWNNVSIFLDPAMSANVNYTVTGIGFSLFGNTFLEGTGTPGTGTIDLENVQIL
ncbi:MAG TPA: hypothetical protein VFH68_10430 [Polyangia bacterium]|nr:hypothetical protein [Polyangia bacterium]